MKKILIFAACLTLTALFHAQNKIFVTPNGNGTGSSWADACNLETAVARSLSGAETTEIWVQKGTHYPTKMLVVPESVKIYGGFSGTEDDLSERDFLANVTIIDGQQKIGSIFRLGKSAELNGLTIQRGNASGNPHKNGGGVYAEDDAVIENCTIIDNTALFNGGGVYASGDLNLLSSTVANNTASNGANLYGNCITQVSTPVIVSHPDIAEKSITRGGSFPALSVSVNSNDAVSYQWFSNTTTNNENGTSLGNFNGAQTATYTPQGSTVGTLYYYCEITNSDGTTKSKVSGAYIVTDIGCNDGIFNFGTISFQTSTQRTITGTVNNQALTQIWSDAVTATGCQKTTYAGGSSGNYNVDCKSNPGYPGDLFSWCAVARFADILCPAPWRVPTKDDIINLDKALGGTGDYQLNPSAAELLKYYTGTGANQWGGAYGNSCNSSGSNDLGTGGAFYWTQTEYNSTTSWNLFLAAGSCICPHCSNDKSRGFALRCVR